MRLELWMIDLLMLLFMAAVFAISVTAVVWAFQQQETCQQQAIVLTKPHFHPVKELTQRVKLMQRVKPANGVTNVV